jgi:uncharacterized protein DUF222
LAQVATVRQLRTAVKLEPRPDPEPRREPERSITKTSNEAGSCYRISLPPLEAAKFDAALASHREALITEWKHDRATGGAASDQRPPFPTTGEAFMRLVEASWDAEASRRPHGAHTTVVVHLDVERRAAGLHLGPLLCDAERRYLTCDASGEVWFERHGQPIGAGRATRVINRRLRRALEHRDRMCAVPGCGATRGLHAHHLRLLGRWRSQGVGQPGAAVSVSSPAAPSGPDHYHRNPGRPHRHRRGRPSAKPGVAGAPTHFTAARGGALPGTARRTRPVEMVCPLPTPTTTKPKLVVV